MEKRDTTVLAIGLHEVSELRWPKQLLTGSGKRIEAAVPLPRLPWASASVNVPMGETAAAGIERVTRLRRVFGFVIAPIVVLLFVLADVLLLLGRFGSLRPSGSIFLILGVLGVLLILTGLIPDQVARSTGTPYVSRSTLRFPRADSQAVEQLRKLNPKATIDAR